MDKALNKNLYKKIKKEADEKFKKHSLYKTLWILKEYKKRGGLYKDSKPNINSGAKRWINEEWVQVVPYLEDNKIIECGSNNKETKACRPTKKINNNTPLTIDELLKIHGKKKLLEIAKAKNENMSGRMNWRTGNFY